MEYNIVIWTNDDKDFYDYVGPFLANRDIAKELGGIMWDDNDKLWFVCTSDGIAVGVAAVIKKRKGFHFCSDYVLPEYRGNGIYDALMRSRVEYTQGERITATVTDMALGTYTRFGFDVMGTTGRYHKMVKATSKEMVDEV